MLTEPVGPRSPDDILTVVYQRTERARRRRRQQLSAAVAIVAFGVAGLVSLFPGDDKAARVRVVDGPNTRTEEASDESATPTTAVASDAEQPATSPTTAATTKRRSQPGGDGNQASAPTTPPLPTTTTLPTGGDSPGVKLLAQEGDRVNDSFPANWYYDIVQAAMQLDQRNDVVVFTTRYRGPDSSGVRDRRTLRSEFDYENDPVVVDVTETDNALGTVTFGGAACSACTADLDDVRAELTVTVPISTVNAYLVAHHGNGASIEQAVISALHAFTAPFGVNDVTADESGDTG